MNATSALNGEVTFDGEYARLWFQRRLPHPPEKVWKAITDPAQVKQWFMASSARVDGKVGGVHESVAGPAQIYAQGKILVWDPPRVYEYEWKTAPRQEIPKGEDAVVRWELQSVPGGTLLTLEHRHLTKGTATGFAPGWHTFLDRMDAMLAGEPMPDWMKRFQEVASGYPGWPKM